MRRFILSALVGAVVYTGGIALEPFEGGPAIVFVPITGLIFSAIFLAALFIPMRAAVRRFVPGSTRRFQACVVGGSLLALVAGLAACISPTAISQSRPAFATFWGAYVVALAVSFFWPLTAQSA
jgi:hypothetical protein